MKTFSLNTLTLYYFISFIYSILFKFINNMKLLNSQILIGVFFKGTINFSKFIPVVVNTFFNLSI